MGKADLKQEISEYRGVLHFLSHSHSGYLQGKESYIALYCSFEISGTNLKQNQYVTASCLFLVMWIALHFMKNMGQNVFKRNLWLIWVLGFKAKVGNFICTWQRNTW